jgi:hypothetical protein
MNLQMQGSAVAATSSGVCADCGAATLGNFCSTCGADMRQSSLGFLGTAVAPVRRSFPVVYLKLLRAPIRETVAFAEDPAYRSYISFALAGIAIYCLFIVPIVMSIVVPANGPVHVSESLLTLMKILSQVGVYVGTAITFALAYAFFRFFSHAKWPLRAYFKLFCLALGFTAPINGSYEFIVRGFFGGTGMTSFGAQMTLADLITPSALASIAVMILLYVYFIGIHRRFWDMPVWRASALYLVAAVISNQLGFFVMWYVGYYTARVLTAAGIVTI